MRRGLRRQRIWHDVLRGLWSGCIYAGNLLQVRGLWRRLRCSASTPGLHLPDHDVLPPEFASVVAPVAVALRASNNRHLRLLHRHHNSSSHHSLDTTTEGLLLQHHECRLPNHTGSCRPTDTTANATSNASSNAASNAHVDNASAEQAAYRDCLQLRSWCVPYLGAYQAELVLPASPSLWSDHSGASSRRPIQLR